MPHVPNDIKVFYKETLRQKIPKEKHYSYLKWLRFYLDFCSKAVSINKGSNFNQSTMCQSP